MRFLPSELTMSKLSYQNPAIFQDELFDSRKQLSKTMIDV